MKKLTRSIGCTMALTVLMTSTVPQGLQARSTVDYKMSVESSSKLLETAFNKFRYEMTVEWDQQDPYFKDYAKRELENSLNELKKRGVTPEQIQDYMLSNILNESA
ncbi:MAG TPA: hypothetical protein VKZ84_07230, partial [Bacteriovoracaceae bacterium]|nr:hypothetical protein [Bacteriovoracaceae bacterium]